jgi:solute carrier family 8 (sodium/calcium exchanger)
MFLIYETTIFQSSYSVFLFQTAIGFFNGYFCFFVSITFIGVCTAVIGDVAAQLGCFIYLKDSVNAIAFVALGTSVPGIRIETN